MKKIVLFISVLLISLALTGCASKKDTDSNQIAPVAPDENIELSDENNSASTEENEQITEEVTEETEETSSENENNEQTQEETVEENPLNDILTQELDEIIEPEVTDMELPPEVVKPEPVIEYVEVIEEPEVKDLLVAEAPVITVPAVTDENPAVITGESDGRENSNEIITGETDTAVSLEGESDGRENTEPEIAVEPEEEPAPVEVIVPSRSVTLRRGENLSVTYPGSGWIYMGSTSEYNNLASKGRKLGSTDTKYTLLAKEPGTQLHHFYKVDNLTGEYIDDYLEVTVLDKKGSSKTTVTAPDYAQIVPPKAETPAKASEPAPKVVDENELSEVLTVAKDTQKLPSPAQTESKPETKPESKSDNTQPEEPVIQYYVQSNEPEIPSSSSDDVIEDLLIDIEEEYSNGDNAPDASALLKQAQELYNDKDFERAYLVLLDFFEYATDNRDEGLYLQGQLLESDSSIKNIKEAVKTYQQLCDNYPSSEYWDKANKRIIYLKRFYIEVR